MKSNLIFSCVAYTSSVISKKALLNPNTKNLFILNFFNDIFIILKLFFSVFFLNFFSFFFFS